MLRQEELSVSYPLTIQNAMEMINGLYGRLAQFIAGAIVDSVPVRLVPQRESDATYSLWRDEEDYKVNWESHASEISRHIDAVGFPYQGAKTRVGDKIFTILEAEVLPDLQIENRTPGKVLSTSPEGPVVVCGKGLLRLTRVQNENGEDALPFSNFRMRFL